MLFGSSMLIARKCALEKSIMMRNSRMTQLTQQISRHQKANNNYKNYLKNLARQEYNDELSNLLAAGSGQPGTALAGTMAGDTALADGTTLTNQALARAQASANLEAKLADIDAQFDVQNDMDLQAMQDENAELEIEQDTDKNLLEQIKTWLKTAQEWIKEGIQSLFGGHGH